MEVLSMKMIAPMIDAWIMLDFGWKGVEMGVTEAFRWHGWDDVCDHQDMGACTC